MKTPKFRFLSVCLSAILFFLGISGHSAPVFAFEANNPNFHEGTDSERIEKAMANAEAFGGVVRITRRVKKDANDRDFWLIDRAILIPGNTTLILENCVVKLSNSARDNLIRSANCGLGIEWPEEIRNVHIMGIGHAELQGADDPRSTGDSQKVLGVRSYGTDAGKEGESQYGDWRNIGVLLACVRDFSITGITIRESHCWGISLEKCSFGQIRNITFFSTEQRTINGKPEMTRNQDGLDLRKGCHDILIDTLHGYTGDDLIALTAIGTTLRPGGMLQKTEVSGMDALGPQNDIWNVTVRNVFGHSHCGHQIVRILNASGIKIHHITIDGVMDTSPAEITDRATVKIGDVVPSFGGRAPLGDTYAIIVNNVHTKAHLGVVVLGSLCDSVISNVVNLNPNTTGVSFQWDGNTTSDPNQAGNARNVKVYGVVDPMK